MGEAEEEFDDEFLRMEYDIAMGRLFQFTENLAGFISMNDENFVYWIERSDRELLGDVFLKGQPVYVSRIMEEDVLPHDSSSIFVSATLSTGGDFRYTAERLGLSRQKSIILESSFNFREQMVIYLAPGLSNPNSHDFIEKSAGITSQIITHLGGNCLVLLTSYRSLEAMKEKIRELTDFPVFSQDEYTSSRAVEMYRDHDNSILMGTHSFWQGIDLPGDLLRGVIMMRLPFSVPDSPVIEAKMERLAAQGKNPFLSFQVPDAVIRFRQGFGRLIRSGSDRGIVAVMDPRIVTKPYGRYFISSVPECETVYTLDDLVKKFIPDQYSNL
jgi:ATP-dependent DNA helicase DinG